MKKNLLFLMFALFCTLWVANAQEFSPCYFDPDTSYTVNAVRNANCEYEIPDLQDFKNLVQCTGSEVTFVSQSPVAGTVYERTADPQEIEVEVVCKDGNGTQVDTVVKVIIPNSLVSFLSAGGDTISNGNTIKLCLGDTTTLTVLPDSFQTSQYVWSSPELSGATVELSPETTTTYSVTVTDNEGCVDSARVTVEVIRVNLVVDEISCDPPWKTICSGESVTMQAYFSDNSIDQPESFYIVWTNSNGDTLLTGNEIVVYPTETTVYTLDVTGTRRGCSVQRFKSDTITVFTAVNVTLTNPDDTVQTVCSGDSITPLELVILEGNAIGTLTWDNSGIADSVQMEGNFLVGAPTNTSDSMQTYRYSIEVVSEQPEDWSVCPPDYVRGSITVYPLPEIHITDVNSQCYGYDDGYINVAFDNGTSPYTLSCYYLGGSQVYRFTDLPSHDNDVLNVYTLPDLADSVYDVRVEDAHGCQTDVYQRVQQIADTLKVTANSPTWVYDGTAHQPAGYTITFGEESYTVDSADNAGHALTNGDVVTATLSLVGNDSIKVTSVTVNRGENTIVNCYYNTVTESGTVTWTPNNIPIVVTSGKQRWTYDGEAHTYPSYTVTYDGTAVEALADDTTKYVLPTGDTLTVSNPASVTDYTEYVKNTFDYTITNGEYYANVATVCDTLAIDKREVTLQGESATLTYNGLEQTINGITAYNLLPNHTWTHKYEASGTDVEDYTGAFIGTDSRIVALPDSDDVTANYSVTCIEGTLTIIPYSDPITFYVYGHKDTVVYSGLADTLVGYNVEVSNTQFSGEDVCIYIGQARAIRTDAGTTFMNLDVSRMGVCASVNFTNASVVLVEDGSLTVLPIATPITITAASDSMMYNGEMLTNDHYTYTEGVLLEGDTLIATVEGNQTDVGTSDNVVTSYKVMRDTVDATASYTFAPSVNGTLKVTKRNVTLTSASDSMLYNGSALTNSTVTVGGDGFVEGESATYDVTGSQTDVGVSENEFTYHLSSGTNPNNYSITTVFGTLKVYNCSVPFMVPTDLTVSNITPTSAMLSWTNTDAESWQVKVGDDNPISVTENPYTLEGLNFETAYSVKVRAVCMDNSPSEWSEAVNFTTLERCPVPTNIAMSDNILDHATLTWTGYSDSYNIQYQRAFGDPNTVTSNSESVTLTELAPNVEYQVQVQGVCEDEQTSWSEIFTFTTTCGITAITSDNPYVETFETYNTDEVEEEKTVSHCWDVALSESTYNAPYVFIGSAEAAHEGTASLEFKGENGMVVLPEFSNDLNTLKLSFYATCTDSEHEGTLKVGYVTDIENPSTFTPIYENQKSETERVSGQQGVGTLMEYEFTDQTFPQNARFALYYTGSNGHSEVSMNLDSCVVAMNTCPRPTNVDVTNIAATYANISCTASAETYNLRYRTGEATTTIVWGDWTTVAGVSNPYTLRNLAPESTYEVQLQAVCTGDETSRWSEGTIFETLDTCAIPANLTVSNITSNSAHLDWSGYNNSYNVRYRVVATNDWLEVVATEDTITLTGLAEDASYEVQVQAICKADASSDWTASVNFETPRQCLSPSNITVSNVLETSADVTWTGTGDNYNVQYRETSANQWQTIACTGNATTITGLTPDTDYEIQVQTSCGTYTSEWTDAVNFSTLPECTSVTDYDNNTYNSVRLGRICWMTSNLRATHYSDGREISNIYKYQSTTNPNADANAEIYGLLYDWYDAMDAARPTRSSQVQGICPTGWRIPDEADFSALSTTDIQTMRSTDYWLTNPGNNATGFNMLPAGQFNYDLNRYENLFGNAYFWSATSSTDVEAHAHMADCHCYTWYDFTTNKNFAYSIRCVKD